MRRHIIAVIGAGDGASEQDISTACEVGRLVGTGGWILVTGGRNAGVMDAASRGANEIPGSLTIGILPDGDTGVSAAVDVPIITDMGEARNNVIVHTADLVIACGVSDPGTVSEVALALKAGRHVILLGAQPAAVSLFASLSTEPVHVATSAQQACDIAADLLAGGF